MDFLKYYQKKVTFISRPDYRINKILEIIKCKKPTYIADVGCGGGLILDKLARELNYKKKQLMGVDVFKNSFKNFNYIQVDITKEIFLEAGKYDAVILGEVMEHVPNPDYLLKIIHKSLHKGGTLIISTPNLVSWANRILILAGVQPLYTETSSEINLGRYYKFLGQGGATQGHLKIFTHKSLEEILIRYGFSIEKKYGVPFFFPKPISYIDNLFKYFIPFASGLLYVARKK